MQIRNSYQSGTRNSGKKERGGGKGTKCLASMREGAGKKERERKYSGNVG